RPSRSKLTSSPSDPTCRQLGELRHKLGHAPAAAAPDGEVPVSRTRARKPSHLTSNAHRPRSGIDPDRASIGRGSRSTPSGLALWAEGMRPPKSREPGV